MLLSTLSIYPSVLCAVLVTVLVTIFTAQRIARRPLPGIPYNASSLKSFLGDITQLKNRPRASETSVRPWFLEQAARHKSAVVQIFLGPFARPTVLLSDYREVLDILTHRDADFKRGKKVDVFKGLLSHAFPAMESYDPRFKDSRNLMRDLMGPEFLKRTSSPRIYEAASRLVELWRLKSSLAEAHPFDVARDLCDFSFDAIISSAVRLKASGGDLDRQLFFLRKYATSAPLTASEKTDQLFVKFTSAPRSPELRALLVNEQSLGTAFYFPWPRWYHFIDKLRPSVRRANRTIRAHIEKQTRNAISRLEQGKDPESALEYIIQRQIKNAEKSALDAHLDDPRIRDGVYGYLLAGHDTSAGSLTWIIRQLVARPEEQSKIRESLQKTYSAAWAQNRVPTPDELTKTAPYLDAFIEEVLRYNCPVTTIGVSTRRDTMILGHKVPKDTTVFLNLTGPSLNMASVPVDESKRSPTCQAQKVTRSDWDDSDPAIFNPERWLKHNTEGEVTFSHLSGPCLSFSAGYRGCWGKRLGYLELRIALTLLVWTFQFERIPEELENWDTYDSLVTAPKQCFVQLSPI
ncbi:cytochrome P450 [Nemania diffusa]|nr:cytochrome P450 [Nemania diffusa]